MASLMTTKGLYSILAGTVNLTSDTIKVMLLNSAYTPVATANFITDISAVELTGTGYAAGFGGSGRRALATKTLTEDDAVGVAIFDAADLTWTGITAGTAKHAAIVKEVTADADSPVLGFVSFTQQVTAGGNLLIAWGANGIFRIGASTGSTANVVTVNYTATGAEGTDFTVTIGSTMTSDVYFVVPSTRGVANVPVIDLPDTLAADRTTTTFRVVTADVLTAGDKLAFLVVQ